MSVRYAFTLVELVIAIVVAAVISVPAGWIIANQFEGVLFARDAAVAQNLARAEQERLSALNNFFAADLALTCPAGSPVTTTIPSYLGTNYTLTRRRECQSGDCCNSATSSQGIKRITVQVTRNGAAAILTTLITYWTKHVTFGS